MNLLSSLFKTKEESISINGLTIKYLEVLNKDELFNNLIEKGEGHEDFIDERIPYWSELWPSAIALSEFLMQNKSLVENKTVLEIGCGLGLPGIVASLIGAKVTMTDYIDEPLQFARQNAQLNEITTISFEKMDWRNPNSDWRADVLLASDVAYEKKSFKPLATAFEKLVKPGGIILLSEPNRKFTVPFFEMLKAKNFSFKSFEYTIQRGYPQLVKVYQIVNP